VEKVEQADREHARAHGCGQVVEYERHCQREGNYRPEWVCDDWVKASK
jgi:hypothetical protein